MIHLSLLGAILLSLTFAGPRAVSARVSARVGAESIALLGPSGLVQVETVSAGTGRYVSLRTLAKAFGGTARVGERQGTLKAGNVVMTVQRGRTRVLVARRAFPLKGLPWFRGGDVLLPVRGSSIGVPGLTPLVGDGVETPLLRSDPSLSVPQVGRVRFWGHPEYTRVVVETSRPARYSLSGLDAAVVRLELQAEPPREPLRPVVIRDGVIKDLVPSGGQAGVVVFEIRRADPAGRVRAFALRAPDRVVVDLFRNGSVGANARPRRPDDDGKPPDGIRVVVLDPGHGGRDWGALGPRGLKEKEIVLDVALRVRRLLVERLGVEVVLTRSEDLFIPLEDRTAMANRAKGDLFLSLHVNADPRGKGEGFEAYFLSRDPSDSEARASALRENIGPAPDGLSPAAQDGVKPILWDITESLHVRESSILADALLDQLERTLGVRNRGIKSGPFAVLRHAAMPSVLVEVAFLTNPAEEARLQTEGHRQHLAEALFAGIARYKARYERRLGLPTAAAPS